MFIELKELNKPLLRESRVINVSLEYRFAIIFSIIERLDPVVLRSQIATSKRYVPKGYIFSSRLKPIGLPLVPWSTNIALIASNTLLI